MLWFDRPACLLFFLLPPLYFLLKKAGLVASFSLPLTLQDWQGAPFARRGGALRAIRASLALLCGAGFAAAVFAAADFSILKRETCYSGTATSVVFIVDISPSMSVPDINGETRFDAAKRGIKEFVAGRPGGSFGLAALGSEAAMLIPPTTDRAAFLARLDSLKIGELGEGSAIGMGLAVAAFHLKAAQVSPAVAALFTDGENNAGEINPLTAARFFRESRLSLVIAGLGQRGSSDFLYEDPQSGIQYSGRFNSEFDDVALARIAEAAGGVYTRAENSSSLDAVFSSLDASAPVAAQGQAKTVAHSLAYVCAICSVLLFLAAWLFRLLLYVF